MAVNSNFWKRFPVAERETPFDADTAITNITNLSAGSVERFNTGFLWRNSQGPPNNKNSYRLPVVDVVNGRMTLIPHAVFTAAAILNGAHGGLEGVVSDAEKEQLRTVVSAIYATLRKAYGDPRVVPPWERNDKPPEERRNRQISAAVTASVNTAAGSLPFAAADTAWSGDTARERLWDWSGGDFRKYRKGFLWWDDTAPELKGSYKLPVADVADGRLVAVPRAVNAVAAVLHGARGGVSIPDGDVERVSAVVEKMLSRLNSGAEEEPVTASGVDLLRPPKEWFTDPQLSGPTRVTVTAQGRVFGHLALWDTCHFGFKDVCRMAPRSNTGYRFFMDGTVLTADGSEVPVGRITAGTGHAAISLGYMPAAAHYDNTGFVVAVAAAGEDSSGIWFSGALTADATEAQVAALRRSPLSGDWRPTRYGLELVAALAVNSPGFPVLGFTASGDMTLVAAGMVLSDEEIAGLGEPAQELPSSGPGRELLERLDAFQARAADLTRQARSRRLDVILKRMGG